MSELPTFTRRQFLHSGLAMISAFGTVPMFLSRSAALLAADTSMRLSSKPGMPDDRVLVVVQLSGGNDGLNTVIPYGADAYYRARPGIGIRGQDVLSLDDRHGIGLHPSLRPIYDMVGDGLASVMQGVGYPNPNRSHFVSMDVWHTGIARDGAAQTSRGRGWIGRAMDQAVEAGHAEPGMGCVCIGGEAPLATQGETVKPVAFERAELFRWAARDLHPALSEAYDALNDPALLPLADENNAAAFIQRTACDAQVASSKIRQAVELRPTTTFPNSGLARQLQMVASMIRAELPTRVYYVAMGGFDTHANQTGQQARLLGEFATAMSAFYGELAATGHRSRVMTMAFSEFGRRVAQNASGGTDHGAAGPMFLFGESVQPGLLGKHPSLSRLDQGDLIYTTDFRSVYADILTNWMQIDARAAMGEAFEPVKVVM